MKDSKFAILASLAMMMNQDVSRHNWEEPRVTGNRPSDKPIPKGTKLYFFNTEGEFNNTAMRKDECVFQCIARDDKNAIRKFNRYKTTINENKNE